MKKRKKSREIYNDEIAESLPVNKRFNIDQFSALTGIKRESSIPRINKLIRGNLITKEKEGRKIKYIMSFSQKKKMKSIGEEWKRTRGRNGKQGQKSKSEIEEEQRIAEACKFDDILFFSKWV
jgi:hypothetical protein